MEDDFMNQLMADAERNADAVDLSANMPVEPAQPLHEAEPVENFDEEMDDSDLKFCQIKSFLSEQQNKVYCQDDSHEFKERLMRLVLKGQQEGL